MDNVIETSGERLSASRGTARQNLAELRSSDAAYLSIKAKILDSEYAPGSQVLEQEIADALSLSRTPVREALVRLQHEGLLTITPRHGVRISALSPSDMREIYEVLLSLEPTAVELLARRRPSPEEISPLIDASTAMERALSGPAPDLAAWAVADERYHLGLASLCGNGRIAAMIMTVWDQAHRARMFTLRMREPPHRSTQEHRAVVDAILAGDIPAARSLYEAHRRRGGEELMAIIERHGLQRL